MNISTSLLIPIRSILEEVLVSSFRAICYTHATHNTALLYHHQIFKALFSACWAETFLASSISNFGVSGGFPYPQYFLSEKSVDILFSYSLIAPIIWKTIRYNYISSNLSTMMAATLPKRPSRPTVGIPRPSQ